MIYIREIERNDIFKINQYRRERLLAGLAAPYRFINEEVDHLWYDSYLKSRNTNVRCAICLEENDEMIGVVYLLDINWIYRTCSYGILIGNPEYRGIGIGKEATLKILDHAFYDLNLNRVELKVVQNNESAINLYKSIGFIEEGVLRSTVVRNKEYINQIIMSILSEEYKKSLNN